MHNNHIGPVRSGYPSLSFELQLGLIESFTVNDGGVEISPLHRAPSVGTDEIMPEGIAPHLGKLGGDFFCAPFGSTEGHRGCMGGQQTHVGDWKKRATVICVLSSTERSMELGCKKRLHCIVSVRSSTSVTLSLVETAWCQFQITQTYPCPMAGSFKLPESSVGERLGLNRKLIRH
ncbi:hypothetical protein RUA4292_00441 [Ruegeria atlantica]|uniref:Uncharacterized protein n=1 Tax=Ruegeria atlantica TaxID=81569 RepID=A0A0N7LPV5_9RHOB|nr:hypothetical protein RUA4292_00441 [Ruegeria atlantica]